LAFTAVGKTELQK